LFFAALGYALLVLSFASLAARQDRVLTAGLQRLAVLGCAGLRCCSLAPTFSTDGLYA